MNESGERDAPTEDSRPLDGQVDFSTYSLQQLRDLASIIDRVAQPLNHAHLLAEIARRSAPDVDSPGSPGRFSARDGWLGWLDAKRRRSPVFGEGRLEIADEGVTLQGWRRTWLGVTEPGIAQLPLESIRNVACDDNCVQFESRQRLLPARRIQFRMLSTHEAHALAGKLPRTQKPGFERRWQEMRLFHERVTALGGNAWAVYALLLANVAVFLVMAISQKQFFGFDAGYLAARGASFGPAVMDGEWWRLLSAQFMHGDLFHLLANLWVLLNAGRLARQLFGSTAFVFVYLASGICGFVASIAWNPGAVAVGASGAIFGVFGALLAFMTRQRSQFPKVLLRAHWLSTLLFAAFNLVSGFTQSNIDNAAHVGGIAGGFVLGWWLARPLLPEARAAWPLWRYAACVAFVSALVVAGYFQVRGIGMQPNAVQRFMLENAWYMDRERANLEKWQQLAGMVSMGAISEAEVSRQFRSTILPFWQEAAQRLSEKPEFAEAAPGTFPAVMLEFARLRRDWADAIADATANQDQERRADSARLMRRVELIQARIDRLHLRAQMEYRPRALAHSLLANRIRALFSGWTCVQADSGAGREVSPEDSAEDAPAMRRAVGCRAQQLFHERDYEALEALMRDAAARLNDLPDGSSSIDAIFGGLSTMFFEGIYDLGALMGRTADWRRAVKDPLMAEIVEVMIFRDWAWMARGQSSADEVSGQSWMLFGHRSQMATAALESLRPMAEDLPYWHKLSIDTALDTSEDKDKTRAIFDTAVARFPRYDALYTSMLRVLMPRWSGSFEEVDELISNVTTRGAEQDLELYARLYWSYFLLEQDDTNIFVEAKASWTNMDIGFADLIKRYPHSDYLLNAYAVMACVALDRERYAELRPLLKTRLAQAAWSDKYSLSDCDRRSRFRE
jgi:membrane associated rhomboid family serine protease